MAWTTRRDGIAITSAVLLVLTGLHDLDHVRQGRALDVELWGVGVLALVTTTATLVLALRRHRLSPKAAILLGAGTVAGVLAVHVAPTWWPLSDSYGEAHVDTASWTIIIGMMVTGTLLVVLGGVKRDSAGDPQRHEIAP